MVSISVEPHPLLDLEAFTTTFTQPLVELKSPDWLVALLALDARAPLARSEAVRSSVRDLLRYGGYKPTGRGKPASEYLVRAAEEKTLSSINVAVDACNAVSLNSGMPISVISLDLASPPFRVGLGRDGDGYAFNAAGQVIDVQGLICLFDSEGPCANAVKDAQRTKTHPATTATLSLVWGTSAVVGLAEATASWYRELLHQVGAVTWAVELAC